MDTPVIAVIALAVLVFVALLLWGLATACRPPKARRQRSRHDDDDGFHGYGAAYAVPKMSSVSPRTQRLSMQRIRDEEVPPAYEEAIVEPLSGPQLPPPSAPNQLRTPPPVYLLHR